MNEFTPPRMESIAETARLFGLPVHFIRQKVTRGEIVAVRAGSRYLVNVDKLAEYLNSSRVIPQKITHQSGIQPIEIGR